MKKNLIFLFIFFIPFNKLSAQLTITSPLGPGTLVNNFAGPGVSVLNVTTNGVTPTAMGTFSCPAGCNIGLSSGIILTSGSAAIAAMPNSGTGQGAAINNLSDTQLATLTTGAIHDACVLEFDFFAASDSIQFNFLFASEEYNDFVGTSANDVVGIFLSGPGITGVKNIALVSGTTTPVSINNVNNGYAAPGIPPTGPCSNCTHFLDNSLNNYTTAYDAMTTVLTAKEGVQPCEYYHLKIAVGDVTDQINDSGILLEENSFTTLGYVNLSANGVTYGNGDTIHVCAGDTLYLYAPLAGHYTWSNGDTTQGIYITQPGIFAVTLNGSNPSCFVFSTFVRVMFDTILPTPVITQSNDTLFSSVTSISYTYAWWLNGNIITGANSPILNINQNGCYVLGISLPGQCAPTYDTLCVTMVNINETSKPFFAKLYPNPFHESAILTFENPQKNIFSLTIFDVTGREMQSMDKIQSNFVVIEKQNLKPGIYFYKLEEQKLKTALTGKMVVE